MGRRPVITQSGEWRCPLPAPPPPSTPWRRDRGPGTRRTRARRSRRRSRSRRRCARSRPLSSARACPDMHRRRRRKKYISTLQFGELSEGVLAKPGIPPRRRVRGAEAGSSGASWSTSYAKEKCRVKFEHKQFFKEMVGAYLVLRSSLATSLLVCELDQAPRMYRKSSPSAAVEW